MYLMDALPYIRGKVCMVTGGGGSIGSELVRRLYELQAEKIIIVDIYENGSYEVSREMDRVCVEIASVREYEKMDYLMSQYKPNIIFHAAAHKHVPFMESNPEEAVKNNIHGTEIMLNLAEKYGSDNFVLISTDKAVEPISIMGASKRVCEMLVYEKALKACHTKFTAVRFGNVLNSNGSVVPLFKKQAEKGVITVTDKEVTRYFMTISQAAELVLLSVTVAEGGEIFVLDMGESIKILDIAEKIIRDAGKEPYQDVKIKFTGLRKGDKLQEKLFFDFEKKEKTRYDKILRVKGSSTEGLSEAVYALYAMAERTDRVRIRKKLFEITGGKTAE